MRSLVSGRFPFGSGQMRSGRGSWEDPGLVSDTELRSHHRKNPINVMVIYWIFHFPFPLCCLVFVGFMASVHPWASPVLFCSRCRCAISSERNQIAFALKSSDLVSHLISLFKGGLEKNMREKQQEMRFKNPDVFIAPCEKWNAIKPANNRPEKVEEIHHLSKPSHTSLHH